MVVETGSTSESLALLTNALSSSSSRTSFLAVSMPPDSAASLEVEEVSPPPTELVSVGDGIGVREAAESEGAVGGKEGGVDAVGAEETGASTMDKGGSGAGACAVDNRPADAPDPV